MPTTINDLKSQLAGGLQKNKYLIEIGRQDLDGTKFNVLCTSASFPARTIQVASVSRWGRKYNMRAETDYGGTYEVTVLDDSSMTLRKFFDEWMRNVDDSGTNADGFFGISSNDSIFGKIKDTVNDVKDVFSTVSNIVSDPGGFVDRVTSGLTDGSFMYQSASYQADLNIWQLDGSGNKVYGYRLENAFPSAMGEVTYDDSDQNNLVSYTLTFTFSEFTPLTP